MGEPREKSIAQKALERRLSAEGILRAERFSEPAAAARGRDAVLDAAGGRAQKKIGQKTVAVGAHRDQVAALLLDPLDDFVGRIAVGQLGLGGNAGGLRTPLEPFSDRRCLR